MLLMRLSKIETKICELYLDSQDDNVLRIKNYRQSLQQKKNWQTKRFKYQIGINRANDLNPYKDIRKSYLNDKDKGF
jgi:hypothetical protein